MRADDVKKNPISSTIDFAKDGVQHGHLRVPHSHDRSAWGSVMIPITQVKNGDGPTALLSGANHGDEYEGPIGLCKLAHQLNADAVQGRVIIVPAMNLPAFHAGRRVSPIDGGNLNRLFPGKPDGTVTEKIADYFTTTLLPMADYVLDIHSGGKSLNFIPFAAMHRHENAVQSVACEAAMMAFGAPYAMYMVEMDPAGLYDTEAESQGKVFVTTELGGGGTATVETIGIADKGIANFLRHAGILSGDIIIEESQLLDMTGEGCFITAINSGLLEPCLDLGKTVTKGDAIARVWSIDHPGSEPRIYRAAIDGILAARHFPSLVEIGDCVAVIAKQG